MKTYETRRSAERIRVEMPVHLDQGTGVTRDVSQSGVFFYTDQSFALGMPLRFALEFDHIVPGEALLLYCRGEVVRTEKSGDRTGVAASISEYCNGA